MNAHDHIDLLGAKVKDKVTGFEGVVTSVSFDLYGCIQAVVTPPAGDGKNPDGRWFDIGRLITLEFSRAMPVPNFGYINIANAEKGPAEKPEMRDHD